MTRVVLIGNLKQYTGGVAEFEFEATTVRQLFQKLGERHPALAPHLEEGIAVAIDGTIHQDAWLESLAGAKEVHLMPQIAGG